MFKRVPEIAIHCEVICLLLLLGRCGVSEAAKLITTVHISGIIIDRIVNQ